MSKKRLALYGKAGFADVETDATRGATIGRDVYNADGSLYEPEAATTASRTATVWRFILEIPAAVQALAALAANQFVARASTGAAEAKPITDFALSLLDDADAAGARTTLDAEQAGTAAAAVAAHEALADPHPQYLTEAEGDAAYDALGAAAAAQAASQPLDATLTALAGLNATAGLVEQTGADAFTKRAIGVASATDVLTRADGDGRYDDIGSADAALAAATALVSDVEDVLAAAGIGETFAVVLTDLNVALSTAPKFFTYASTATNAPTANSGGGFNISISATVSVQLVIINNASRGVFYRLCTASTWGTWVEVSGVAPRVSSSASGNITPNPQVAQLYLRTAQSAALTINAPSTTPVDGQRLGFRLRDDGTGRAITWNGVYRAMTTALPTTTVANKTLRVEFEYNAGEATYDLLNVQQQA